MVVCNPALSVTLRSRALQMLRRAVPKDMRAAGKSTLLKILAGKMEKVSSLKVRCCLGGCQVLRHARLSMLGDYRLC